MMALDIDLAVASVFGSAARTRTLAILANSPAPLTGYRIARVSGDEETKVYSELRRLAEAGLVRGDRTESRTLWELVDPDIRSFLRRRVRIVGEKEWNAAATPRLANLNERSNVTSTIPGRRTSPRRPMTVVEFRRSASKDRALAAAGLPVSRRWRRK